MAGAPPNEPALPVDNVGQLLTNAVVDAGIVGIDESIEQPILTRAFRQANWLLAQWARKRWLVYRLQDYSFVSTGAQNYSVGLGATININPRPDRLEYAFLRFLPQPGSGGSGSGGGGGSGSGSDFSSDFSSDFGPSSMSGSGSDFSSDFSSDFGPPSTPVPTPSASSQGPFNVDIQLGIIQSHEDYARITIKNLGTISWRIFYDPIWPVGLLFPWPVPQASLYEIHVGFKVVLPRFSSIQQAINFPPEYEAALNWGLARRLRASYQMPADPTIDSLARDALNIIRLANQAMPTLQMPAFLRNRGRGYDYHGDTDSQ